MSDDNLITQQATGSSRGAFDKVSFSVRVEGRGETGPKAKAEAQKRVAKLRKIIDRLEKDKIAFLPMDVNSQFSIQQEQAYDRDTQRQTVVGYLASFTMVLVTNQVDRAPDVIDALTSEDGLSVDSPNFSVCSEKSVALQDAALQQAWNLLNQRLDKECKVLGVYRGDLEVCSWNVRYNDRGREPVMYAAAAGMAMDAPGDENSGPLVQSGAATVTVNLSVTFRRGASKG